MERNFKGIWIPKDIWLSKDLTTMEKLFLIEIDSLDNEKHCYASNAYFSEFFDISKGRCSQIIKSLETKKYITIDYEKEGKQITKRIITVVNKLSTPYLENDDTLFRKPKHPYLENAKENNTFIINPLDININTYSSFDKFWELYPKKTAKKTVEQKFNKLSQETQQKIIDILPKFIETKQWKDGYIPNPTTFLNQERYNDDLTAYKEPTKEPKFPKVERVFKFEKVEEKHKDAFKRQKETIRKYGAFFIFNQEVSALEILQSLSSYLPKNRFEEAMIKFNNNVYEYKEKSKYGDLMPVFELFLRENYAK